MALLDGPMRSLGKTLLGVFGTANATITRTTRTYSPETDDEVKTVAEAKVPVSPPAPFQAGRVDGTEIRSTDSRCLVSAIHIEDAGMSLAVGTHVSLTIQIGSETFAVVRVWEIRSGDQVAAYELQLRK